MDLGPGDALVEHGLLTADDELAVLAVDRGETAELFAAREGVEEAYHRRDERERRRRWRERRGR